MNDQKPFARNLRILVIDDQENIHEDYRKIIAARTTSTSGLDAAADRLFEPQSPAEDEAEIAFELDSAFQGEEGFQMVQRALDDGRPYAMAFVDIRMPPGWDGIETVRRIWEIDREILIVLCSAYSDYSWSQIVQQLGRNDRFLILKKPFDIIEVRQFAMALTQRWSLARTDALTGAMNRRSMQEHLDREWAKSVRCETPLSCVMLDLDYFKKINDLEGHLVGDAVLKSVAETIQERCRPGDLLFRYGGEEFCVVLPNTTEEVAAAWADETRGAVAASPIVHGQRKLSVTASLGVAERLLDTRCAAALIARADQALLVAKQAGRNRVIRSSVEESTMQAHGLAARHASAVFRGAVASDAMSFNVASLKPETTVGEAARFLLNRGLGSAPLVDEDGKLIGVVSEKDVLGVMLAPGAWSRPIDEICQHDVVAYDEQTPIEKIFDFLSRVSMRRVIIVSEGRPVGSISRTSLLRWFGNWVLSAQCILQDETAASSERVHEAIKWLALRANRLADQFSSMEAGSFLNADSFSLLIGDVTAMQDLLKDIVTLFSVKNGGLTCQGIGGIEGLDVLEEAKLGA